MSDTTTPASVKNPLQEPLLVVAKPKPIITKLRLFIMLSAGVHLGFFAGWGVPAYVKHLAEVAAIEKEKQHQIALKEAAKTGKEETLQQNKVADKEDVKDLLKKDFDKIVQNDLSKDEKNKIWEDLTKKLDEKIEKYVAEVSNTSISESKLETDLQEIKTAMVTELDTELKSSAVKDLAENFIDAIDKKIAPQLADAYHKNIEKTVGVPLQQEGAKIVSDEKNLVERERAEIKGALDGAILDVGQAKKGLIAAQDRIKKAKDANALASKSANGTAAQKARDLQTDNFIAGEAKTVTQAETALKAAGAKLGKAAERAGDFSDELKAVISDVAGQKIDNAQAKVGAVGQAFKDGDKNGKADGIEAALKDAVEAAQHLTDATNSARDTSAKATFDPTAQTRSVLKNMKNGDIKDAMNKSFDKNFSDTTAPRLAEKLGDAFEKSLANEGIQDPNAVAEVRAKIQGILKDKVPSLTHAGEASTDPLAKSEHLGDAKDSDNKNATRAKAVADRVKKAVSGLADKQLAGVTNDTKEDDVAVSSANAVLSAAQNTQPKRSKHPKVGPASSEPSLACADTGEDNNDDSASESAAPSDGKIDDGKKALRARVANLSKNVKAGRMGLLEDNNNADGKDGDMAGDAVGSDGKKNDAKKGGKDNPEAKGLGLGDGPDAGTDLGLGGIAGIRKKALDREIKTAKSGGGSGHSSFQFDKAEHAKQTAEIKSRDAAAAQGEVWERKGAEGAVSTAEENKERIAYGVVMIPTPPAATATGAPAEIVGTPEQKDPFKPKFATKMFASIPYLKEPLIMNGEANPWKDIPVLLAKPEWDGKPNPTLKLAETQPIKMAWDNTGLYFSWDIKDANNNIDKVTAKNFWEGDGVEIFFDARNSKDSARGSAWTQQFWLWPAGMKNESSVVGGEAVMVGKEVQHKTFTKEEVQRYGKRTADGWLMQAHIPFERIRNFKALPGRIVGLNFLINTGTNLGYYWAGNSAVQTSVHPDTWGDVLLAGCDGKLEVVDKLATELKAGETTKSLQTQNVGEPLRIRITDADMSFSDTYRDKLTVTVKARGSGETRIVTLEETGEKTGIFEGAIRTDWNLGEPHEKVLSLYEGETISVLYLDQARANGARNVDIKLLIKTVAGVLNLASTK